MSHRGTQATRTVVTIRLIDDPKVTARFQIQEQVAPDRWNTLRVFSNEVEARTLFDHIKEHGLSLRVLDTAKASI